MILIAEFFKVSNYLAVCLKLDFVTLGHYLRHIPILLAPICRDLAVFNYTIDHSLCDCFSIPASLLDNVRSSAGR